MSVTRQRENSLRECAINETPSGEPAGQREGTSGQPEVTEGAHLRVNTESPDTVRSPNGEPANDDRKKTLELLRKVGCLVGIHET